MKMSSSLSNIIESGINVLKSNSQIIKNKKYYEISTTNALRMLQDNKVQFINCYATFSQQSHIFESIGYAQRSLIPSLRFELLHKSG